MIISVFGRVENILRKGGKLLKNNLLVLTHYKTTNFRLFQTETVCSGQCQIWQKWKKENQTSRNHCGEKENLLVTSNFSFSHSIFKRLLFQRHQKVSLCGNGLTSWREKTLAEQFWKKRENASFVAWESFVNTVGQEENTDNQHFSLLECFSIRDRNHYFTLYHTILTFTDPKIEGNWKTLWEKENILVTSIFSFSHSVLYSIKEIPLGSRGFSLYRIGPLPFSMACRKRRLNQRRTAAFLIICRIAAGWVVLVPNPIFFSRCK